MSCMPNFKSLVVLLTLLFALSGCIGRELDDNEIFRQAQPTEMDADNALLLSKIFVIAESNTYLWFDLHNLRGLLYEYRAEAHTLTFKQVPSRFLNWGETTASFVFTLQQVEGNSVLLPGGKTQKGSKAVFELTLKAIDFGDGNAPVEVEKPFNVGSITRTLKPYTKKLTLVN